MDRSGFNRVVNMEFIKYPGAKAIEQGTNDSNKEGFPWFTSISNSSD